MTHAVPHVVLRVICSQEQKEFTMFGFSFAPSVATAPFVELGNEFFVTDVPEGDVLEYFQGKLGGAEALDVEDALVASGIDRQVLYTVQDKVWDNKLRVVRRRTA
jgi:hypothetical protein